MREQTKKRKNENRLPFYHFSFYAQTIKKRKNENRLPFYQFSFYVQTIQKNGKMKIDFRFIIFRFMREQSQGFWTGADTTHIVGGGCIRGGGGGHVLAKRIVVAGDECAARDLPADAPFFISGSGILVPSFGGLSASSLGFSEESRLLGKYSLCQDIANIELWSGVTLIFWLSRK